MFLRLSHVVYRVRDLASAREWYAGILGTKPLVDLPQVVVFSVGNSSLALSPLPTGEVPGTAVIVYWEVEDIEAAWRRLQEEGAKPQTEIAEVFGRPRASLYDPFGNLLGIVGKPRVRTNSTIGEEPSGTALSTASLRALSATDEREEIRGRDHLARIFLTEERKRLLIDQAFRKWTMENAIPAGMYEFLIARTAWIDGIVESALREGVPQLVFLGAGYDSRPYRFRELAAGTRIYELDAPPTQNRKRELLAKEGVSEPENVTYVPVHFEKESIGDALSRTDYDPTKRSLFVWEGVIYYLTRNAITSTLAFIRHRSGKGSRLVFDCQANPSRPVDLGEKNPVLQAIREQMPSEPILFRIDRKELPDFLEQRGFRLTDALDSRAMEERYLKLRDGAFAGRVLEFMHLAEAESV
jgi:methyltransferase (TIGR00027 family)